MLKGLLWVLTVGGAILVGAYCGLVTYFLLHKTRRGVAPPLDTAPVDRETL